jgi:type IV pilus assembly protein PilX
MNKLKATNQKGAALIVSLIILVLMTLLGLSSISTSSLEEKMTANLRDHELAFQAAEIALRDAEKRISAFVTEPIATQDGSNENTWNTNAMDPTPTNAAPWWLERDAAWWSANGVASVNVANVATPPRYIIEELVFDNDDENKGTGSPVDGIVHYRITARGTGGSDQARVLLQSTVIKRY